MFYQFKPIAIVHSCFKEKFGIARQGCLIPDSKATLEFIAPFNDPNALREIESYSHLWIIFVFHQNKSRPFKPTVRPPRLGGNHRIGVFSSRSGFRPNPIGLSLVRLERVYHRGKGLYLDIAGVDLLEGTPVLDIKPYLPWSDVACQASAGFADSAPAQKFAVQFSPNARFVLDSLATKEKEHLENLIIQVLQNDPRPAIDHHRSLKKEYGIHLYHWNIRWVAGEKIIQVVSISSVSD